MSYHVVMVTTRHSAQCALTLANIRSRERTRILTSCRTWLVQKVMKSLAKVRGSRQMQEGRALFSFCFVRTF